jgi:hypothetical protein
MEAWVLHVFGIVPIRRRGRCVNRAKASGMPGHAIWGMGGVLGVLAVTPYFYSEFNTCKYQYHSTVCRA